MTIGNRNFMGNENSNITFSAFLAISGLIAFDFVSADNEKTHMYMELKRIYAEQAKYLISNLMWSLISTLNKQKGPMFFSSSFLRGCTPAMNLISSSTSLVLYANANEQTLTWQDRGGSSAQATKDWCVCVWQPNPALSIATKIQYRRFCANCLSGPWDHNKNTL